MAADPGPMTAHTPSDLTPRWPNQVAHAGQPNVVVIVLDDVGYAQLGCYGSGIETPTLDRLAADGLAYTNFHSTAMCSPSRACLLTGRNHHSVGVGAISHYSNGLPNNRGKINPGTATLPGVLRSAGYATLAVGKWHLTPPEETNAVGPFDAWPLGVGFERFYGFLDSMTDQWTPDLFRDNHRLDVPQREAGYHLSEDLTREAITMVREQVSLAPERPFFLYLAYGACHAPHQAPEPFLDKYRGRFDHGWDEERERCFSRQQAAGLLPTGTRLAPRNPGVPLWADLTAAERALHSREQEAFAAFLDHTDACIGRLVEELAQQGILDSTLVIVVSDNGAAGDAGEGGTLNELRTANQDERVLYETSLELSDIGGPLTWNNYARGWAMAGNTPHRWYKRNVHGGGCRVPLIIHHPQRVPVGGLRRQFHHMVDLMPTVLDVIGIDPPRVHHGVPQDPMHGMSLGYTFDDEQCSSRRRTQYFEMLGDRGIVHGGWKAVTRHTAGVPYEDDVWELFHLDTDFSESEDLASTETARLSALIDQWWDEADRMGVLPLDDRQAERHRLLPPWVTERTSWTFHPGMAAVTADSLPFLERSYSFEADVDVPELGAEGVLIAVGGRFGGSSLFVLDGHLVHDYNSFGDHSVLVSDVPVPAGRHTLSFHLVRLTPGTGVGELRIDGRPVGTQPVAPLLSHWMGPEPVTVGKDGMSPVSTRYASPFPFTGKLRHVRCDFDRSPAAPNPVTYASRLGLQ